MYLKLIVSAHRATQSEHDNAVATSNLLAAVSGFGMTLVQGMYNGISEVSVQLEGFTNFRDMLKAAEKLCKQFKQECVYYEHNGIGSLLMQDGTHRTLGPEIIVNAAFARSAMFQAAHKCYTQYRDGTAIITETPARLAA